MDLVAFSANIRPAGAFTDEIQHLATLEALKNPAERLKLQGSLTQFIRMYRPHAAREDTCSLLFYHCLRQIVSSNEYDSMGEQFEDEEHRLFGADGFEKVVDEVAGLEKKVGIRKSGAIHPCRIEGSMSHIQKLLRSKAPAATLLIRLMVGSVFLSEGIQKFLFSDELGVGRFTKIGIPSPEILAPLVGVCEVLFGFLLIVGFMTRLSTVPLIIIILTAIGTTKLPLLVHKGPWVMAHEARTDWSMLLGAAFLLMCGAGPWSLDHLLISRAATQDG
ncbi:MAG: DoxX family protein [Terriglobia bacterium]